MPPRMMLRRRQLVFTGRVRDLRRWLAALSGAGLLLDYVARRN